MSASARTAAPRRTGVSGRTSFAGSASARSGRAGSYAAGFRGAAYVPTSVAEALPDYAEPSISVVPGRGVRPEPAGLPAGALALAKLAACVLVALALIAVARVAITSATAACALETKAIEQNIDTARTEGNDLEVAQSVLSNPSRIKHKAESLGMAAPSADYTDHIVLPDDVVSVDANGKLSLSGSAAAVAAQ